MPKRTHDHAAAPRPGFVVLRRTARGDWQVLGEFPRQPGLTARAARTHAIRTAAGGPVAAGDAYAAVLRSEWRIAQVWDAPDVV